MVLCRFFQQGTCRYGQNCKFEHATPQYATSNISPLLRQTTQVSVNVTAPRNTQVNNAYRSVKKDARDIFTLISKDVTDSERGGVWPLSCYNFWPTVAHSNVPGLEDLSPEEMRHLQMQAQAGGNLDACNQQIQQMYQQARLKFNSLKVQSPETLSLIESLTRSPATSASQFSFARQSNVVQDSWPTASATGSQSSIFGGSSGSTSTKSVFGGTSGQTSAGFGSVFAGSNNQQSLLGGGSQFGTALSSPQTSSIFGGTSQQTQQPALGLWQGQQPHTLSGAPAAQPTTAFAVSPAPQAASPFGVNPPGGQSSGNIFGGSSTAVKPGAFSFALPNTFGGAASGAQTVTPSLFGATSNSSPSGTVVQCNPQPGGSIFGGFTGSQSSAPSSGTSISMIFTSFPDLTEAEKREFEAETFTLGKIPTRPPPRELC